MIISKLQEIHDLLVEAINTKSWSLVSDVVGELSGESIEVEEDDDVNQIISMQKQLEDIMARMSAQKETKKATKKSTRTAKKKTTKTPSKPDQVQTRVNKFDQIYEEIKGDIGKEAGYDLIDDRKKNHTKLRRPKYEPVNAVCTECGKSRLLNPSLVKHPYVCDRCVASKIRR